MAAKVSDTRRALRMVILRASPNYMAAKPSPGDLIELPRVRVMLLSDEPISHAVWEAAMDKLGRLERRISLHYLRVVMAVAQAGSMGKAARLLATSQPAISRSIGALEQALGVRLFDRG